MKEDGYVRSKAFYADVSKNYCKCSKILVIYACIENFWAPTKWVFYWSADSNHCKYL